MLPCMGRQSDPELVVSPGENITDTYTEPLTLAEACNPQQPGQHGGIDDQREQHKAGRPQDDLRLDLLQP